MQEKNAINELERPPVVWGLEHDRFYLYGKQVTLKTDHQALQPLLRKNRAHKQYSARLTRWIDRLSHFDVSVQYCAGKHMNLTDYLSRNPVGKPENEDEYEEEYAINCIEELKQFTERNGSIREESKKN